MTLRIAIVGMGRMGTIIDEMVSADPAMEVVARVDADAESLGQDAPSADVVIDFSHESMLDAVAAYVRRTGAALVSGTTGYSAAQMEQLAELGKHAAVLYSANYSLGVAVLRRLAAQAAEALADFDIEIIETHHNQKADAPSGTAKLLLDAVNPDGALIPTYGREGMCGKRDSREIGVHAVRGGTVAGVHTVSFFGEDEEVSLTHRATSRRIFAAGAVAAARKMVGRAPGFYAFDDVMFS